MITGAHSSSREFSSVKVTPKFVQSYDLSSDTSAARLVATLATEASLPLQRISNFAK
jgi:hypothetical protein